jgi:FAD/FMN-containing dehydrogenase
MSSSVTSAISDLATRFAGQLLQPTDSGYEDARKIHNGLVDKRPALILRCRGVADVVEAVNFARSLKLEVAVRGGGHNVAGRATVDNGVMIDLSLMKGIYVDPKARTARAMGGATWGEYNRETQMHGLASTGGVISTTGVAGLTLGGGWGYLHGKYGLAIDNLRSVQLVLADGRIVSASEDDDGDLFWAVRGGGGNFGIATSLEYNVHPVGPSVMGGMVAFPSTKARDVFRFYRDMTAAAPDELSSWAALVHGPDGSMLAVIVVCYCGSLASGEAAVKHVKSFGPPLLDTVAPMSYAAINQLFDGAFPKGALNYWKSSFLSSLSDDVIDAVIDWYGRVPSPMSGVLFERWHGAATRVAIDATAFPHRSEGYNLLLASEWTNAADTERNIAWARDGFAAMQRFVVSRRYVNYLGDDEVGEPAAEAYGPNYARLRQLKAKFDPTNVFHINQNIRPFS